MVDDLKDSTIVGKKLSKPFMAAGPALHYSHQNVQSCWMLILSGFVSSCFLWSKIVSGQLFSFSFQSLINYESWQLCDFVTSGISIFEYPWQIAVLGILMSILIVVPVIVSQMMSFVYSWPFLFSLIFLANLPFLAVVVLISCIAVSCRPLRFRSRFISIALCIMPQFIYVMLFGRTSGLDPVKWGFAFTPWLFAWAGSFTIAGIVLIVGHFNRYKPGIIYQVTIGTVLSALIIFMTMIGFDELDYQLYVAKNNPEQINEFYDHSITGALDATIEEPAFQKYLLTGYFYPIEPIEQRSTLKKEIQSELLQDRWPSWFIIPPDLNYQDQKRHLLEQYDRFITTWPKSNRMPIALYYKAMLSEYSVDIRMLDKSEEFLHFYNDYPFCRARGIWHHLYNKFSNSLESLEARWRLAKHLSGSGVFAQANILLTEADDLIRVQQAVRTTGSVQAETFERLLRVFESPCQTVMTELKLRQLHQRIKYLTLLISDENQDQTIESKKRLARFVMLNPHSQDYNWHLDELLDQMDSDDKLIDNISLAKTKLIADDHLKCQRLLEIYEKYSDRDSGIEALYEFGLLKRRLWNQTDRTNLQQKDQLLHQALEAFETLIAKYPHSIFAAQIRKNLADLPKAK